jgi:hypothetical protein
MFRYPTLRIDKLLDMHRYCPECHQDLVPEPGFYFSAMYFSYAINVALMVTFGVGYEILMKPDNIFTTLASVFIPPLMLAPWNFRISRALALYLLGGIRKRVPEETI